LSVDGDVVRWGVVEYGTFGGDGDLVVIWID
jgi:hypothetical protein